MNALIPALLTPQVEEELPEVPAGEVSGGRHEALVGALGRGEGPPLQEDEGEEAPQVAGGQGPHDRHRGWRSGSGAAEGVVVAQPVSSTGIILL